MRDHGIGGDINGTWREGHRRARTEPTDAPKDSAPGNDCGPGWKFHPGPQMSGPNVPQPEHPDSRRTSDPDQAGRCSAGTDPGVIRRLVGVPPCGYAGVRRAYPQVLVWSSRGMRHHRSLCLSIASVEELTDPLPGHLRTG